MKFKKSLVLSLFCLVLITFTQAGCMSIGSGTDQHIDQTTLGKELIDLKKALEQEALSEEEYLIQKRKLLGE